MTAAVIARSPLQNLSMSSSQRPRRRSARLAFDDEGSDVPVKRSRSDGPAKENGTAQTTKGKANGAGAKRSKAAYDEDDNGFQFSRKTTRKRKASVAPELAPVPEAAPKSAPKKTAPAPTTRRKKNSISSVHGSETDGPTRRRSARLSGDKEELSLVRPQPEKPKRAKKTAESRLMSDTHRDKTPPPPSDDLHVEKKRNGTKIALPFADTPIIRRNKEMRKGSGQGHRRSSTGMRGRRASSLIDSGTSNAVPHAEVESVDFYKHIEQSLPEPRRMKQLLTWCGTRALLDKPSGAVKDANEIMAARAMQEEILKDFSNKNEMSNWFDREDSAPFAAVKKPNPENAKLASKLGELEEAIKRLKEEKSTWEALITDSSRSSKPPEPTTDASIQLDAPDSPIDTSNLDESQLAILPVLTSRMTLKRDNDAPIIPKTADSEAPDIAPRLRALTSGLEQTIDSFAHGIHMLGQYRLVGDRTGDRILESASQALDQRDKEAKERAGTEEVGVRDVLSTLGSMLGKR